MFGTMGFSELIIILVIVLIIFGAGKLPQIGEGVGKALKGFKKEVNDIPPAEATTEQNDAAVASAQAQAQPMTEIALATQPATVAPVPSAPNATAPYTPGPELTPGTTAVLMAAAGPQGPQVTHPAKPRMDTGTPAQAATGSARSNPNRGIRMMKRLNNLSLTTRSSFELTESQGRCSPDCLGRIG